MNVNYHQKSVEIMIENHLIKKAMQLIPERRYFLISDKTVYDLYGHHFPLESNFIFIMKPGERRKNWSTVKSIIYKMMRAHITKYDCIIALGGGVVGDIAGFVASIYKRGMDYIQVPTTLVAQIDSSIGGKVGINLMGYKNQLGSIYHPTHILIDPEVLSTLKFCEFLSGMGEVVKYAALFDANLFEKIENKSYQLVDVITRCVELKVEITKEDEFDTGRRHLLNFGHTIGHAIEAKYHLPHGVSVGYGMVLETNNERIKNLLRQLGFCFDLTFTGLHPYILQDKKIHNQKIMKVKLSNIGEATLEEVDINEYIYE